MKTKICPKCGSNKIGEVYIRVQATTNNIDEALKLMESGVLENGTPIKFECEGCGHEWDNPEHLIKKKSLR